MIAFAAIAERSQALTRALKALSRGCAAIYETPSLSVSQVATLWNRWTDIEIEEVTSEQ